MPSPESSNTGRKLAVIVGIPMHESSVSAIRHAIENPRGPHYLDKAFHRALIFDDRAWSQADLDFLKHDIQDLQTFLDAARHQDQYHPNTLHEIEGYLTSQKEQLRSLEKHLSRQTAVYKPYTLTAAERALREKLNPHDKGVSIVLREVGGKVAHILPKKKA